VRTDGIGLSTTRERLARLYGADGRFALIPRPSGSGVTARIVLPFRAAEVA